MTGILDRMRTMTPATLANVRSDFDDDAPYVRATTKVKEMRRIVKGADDLVRPAVPNLNSGMVKTADWSDDNGLVSAPPVDDRTGLPTERQVNYMISLMLDLKNLNMDAWNAGNDYIVRMNTARAWDPARGGNASRWIDRLKAKIAELRAAAPVAAPPAIAQTEFDGVPDGHYAIADREDGMIKFYRVNTARNGRRYLDIQASDDRFPIRNAVSRQAILDAIREDGTAESMAAYGRLIGRCGRCHVTLTNAESRAWGIGPDCRSKM